jgi:Leucine-rich repeat (LRR) protein
MKILILTLFLTGLVGFKIMVNQPEIKIDLRGKHLKTIPKSVWIAKNVVSLDLGSSNVTFYPPLSALKDPNSNHLTALPKRIGELSNLKTLILNTNNLSTLPNSITKLEKLEVLDLSKNPDLVIINELDKLKKLPNLRVLKIIGVKMDRNSFKQVKSALKPEMKIVVDIQEYFESLK